LATVSAGLARAGQDSGPARQSVAGMRFDPRSTVRLGVIGTGGRGNSLVDEFMAVPGVEIKAICDVVADKAEKTKGRIVQAGKPTPAVYHRGDHAYEELVARDDLDLVIIATPWIWHTPMALAGMKQGKHVAVEVPAARTIDECWELVDMSESTRRHCVQLENCCYGYNEMMVWNMVRAGLFGETTHAACAYNHDLRSILFSKEGEGQWRRFEHLDRNGNLYPTHGLGPVAHYLDIHRGDRFDTLVSMSSPAASLAEYRKTHLAADDPRQKEVYRCGDLNISLIRTVRGKVITLEHNTSSPQPYDRINLIAGTKGMFRDYPARIYVDGSPHEEFGPIDPYKTQYEHPLWTKIGAKARELGGHDGMDYVMAWRLIECMKEGAAPDIDVYDAAAWSAPGPLSEQSVAAGSAPVRFPDFTRHRWQQAGA
jgi:predicted dehydrogenase